MEESEPVTSVRPDESDWTTYGVRLSPASEAALQRMQHQSDEPAGTLINEALQLYERLAEVIHNDGELLYREDRDDPESPLLPFALT